MSTISITKIANLNAMVYLPSGYDSKRAYPCMIFLPGAGEIGTNVSALTIHGPFLYLKDGFDLGLDIIVIAIQNTNANPQPKEIEGYVSAVKSAYNITAIIATGLSRGGQDWNWFANNAESQLAEIGAFALFSAQGFPTTYAGALAALTPALYVKYNTHYWIGCGTADSFYAPNKAIYTALKAAGVDAVWTEWSGVGHSDPVWSDAYNPAWTKNTVGKSIYKWASDLFPAQGAAIVLPPPVKIVVFSINLTDGKKFTLYADGTYLLA